MAAHLWICLLLFWTSSCVVLGQYRSDPATGSTVCDASLTCLNGASCAEHANNGTKYCNCTESQVGEFCQHRNPCFTGNARSPRCNGRGRCEVVFPPDSWSSLSIKPRHHCHCNLGYTATLCEMEEDNVCKRNPCQNRGVCKLTTSLQDYVCECRPGYRGQVCNKVDFCVSSPCRNGGNCTSSDTGFTCDCPSGWYGSNCHVDLNECVKERPCRNGGSCKNLAGSYQCTCPRGWTGQNCTEIHRPCQPNPCENGGRCLRSTDPNDEYKTTCECPVGFSGPRCERNIDDCLRNQCENGATCIDGINSYTCVCPPTFKGIYCTEDVDECARSPCRNGATCRNMRGGYECLCVNGWEGKNCQINTNECSEDVCMNGGTCRDGIGSYRCDCPPGKTGLNCQLDDACVNNPCNNGYCLTNPVDGNYTCQCPQGLTGPNCQTDIDECAMTTNSSKFRELCEHGGQCINTPGSFYCQCAPGYTGSRCEVNINECAGNPCLNDGTCLDAIGYYQCVCMPGFTGINCEINIDECASNPCQNGGHCRDLVGGFECICPRGYYGETCAEGNGMCNVNPCRNGGICKEEGQKGIRCECPPGYIGDTCEKSTVCASTPCKHGGECRPENNGTTFACFCRNGFTGPHCEFEVNPCSGQPCINGGICKAHQGSYKCSCPRDFSGQNCELNLKSQTKQTCYDGACYHGGQCIVKSNFHDYECKCPEGYIGPRCEAAVDRCLSNPCDREGSLSCQQVGNSYKCQCRSGFSGDDCSKKLTSLRCSDLPCLNGGICSDGPSGPKCSCRNGFTGLLCEEKDNNIPRFAEIPVKYALPKPEYVCPYPECKTLAGNGQCDQKCNNIECGFDNKECSLRTDPWQNCTLRTKSPCWSLFRNGICDQECNNIDCLFDGFDCGMSVGGCPNEEYCQERYANGVCDPQCNRVECDFDGLDCDQSTPKLADGILFIIFEMPPRDFRRLSSVILRSLGKVLRTVVTVKKYDNGTEMIDPWTLNGGMGKTDSIGATGTAVAMELDNRRCEGECFETADAAAKFLAARNQQGALQNDLPYDVYSVYSQGSQEGLQGGGSKMNKDLLWLLLLGVVAVAFICVGVMVNRNKKRVRAVTWFPEGFIKSTSTAFLNGQMGVDSDNFKKPGGAVYDNPRHSNMTVGSFFDGASEKGITPPQAKRRKAEDSTENHKWNHYDEMEMRKADRYASTPPHHQDHNGLDINQLGDDGYSPLMLTIARGSGLDQDEDPNEVQMVRDFLMQGANTEIQSLSSGETALHLAARFGRTEMARLLLEHGANAMARDNSGRTPLHSAVAADAPSLVLLFKSAMGRYKIDFNARDNQGWSPLIEAVKLGTPGTDIVDEILKVDQVDVNQADNMQRTALHHAAAVNNAQACKQLLYRSAKVDIQDENAQTPLFIAAREGNIEAARELLEFKANPEMANDEDVTPDAIAKKNGHKNIVKLLDEHREMVHSPPQNFPGRNVNIYPPPMLSSAHSAGNLQYSAKLNQSNVGGRNGPTNSSKRRMKEAPVQVADLEYVADMQNMGYYGNFDPTYQNAEWKGGAVDLKAGFPGHMVAPSGGFKFQQYGLPIQAVNGHYINHPSNNQQQSLRRQEHLMFTPSPGSPGQYSSSPASDWSDGVMSPPSRMPGMRMGDQMTMGQQHQQFHYVTAPRNADGSAMFM